MSPLVVLIFIYHITYPVQPVVSLGSSRNLLDLPPQALPEQHNQNNGEDKKDANVEIHVTSKNETKPAVAHVEKPQEDKKKPSTQAPAKNVSKIEESKTFKPTEMESGAVLRGVTVIVILTTLVLVYMALRTYCGGKSKKTAMVSKYGVRTRRSDIEMTPLPLDEDEEDETLFEVHNANR